MTELAVYEHAKEALAAAVRFDEVTQIHSAAEKAAAYAKIANDRRLQADAAEIVARAERKLGIMLRAAKDGGLLSKGGRPANSNLTEPETGSNEEPVFDNTPFTLAEIGVDKKLSSRAQKAAALADDAFEHVVERARDRILSSDAIVINPAKDVSTAGKKAARAEREAELGRKQVALPEARFGVIYADPEWQFGTWSENGMDRSADNRYPTSGLDVIKDRDVGSLAADDCVLFLWATVPMLPQALEVMAAWGFAYKSHMIWAKDRVGTGYWFRNQHELLLVGTRGKVPAPAMGEQFPSVIEAPVGAHSAKPEKFYEVIEAYFPTLPRIELNARVARPGWVRWGYEAPEETALEGVAPNALLAAAELRETYEGEITLLAPKLGKLSMGEAENALRAGRAAGVSPMILALDLQHPLGTVKTWLNRLGLTSIEHMNQLNAARSAEAQARKAGEP